MIDALTFQIGPKIPDAIDAFDEIVVHRWADRSPIVMSNML